MTGQLSGGSEPTEFGLPGHDLDLLADYLAGALTGTPDEAEVARRIADEPDWAYASAELSRSTDRVSADLAEVFGAPPEPMPADVAERIAAALAAAAPVQATAAEGTRLSLVPGTGTAGPKTGSAVPRTRTGRAPRHRSRLARPLAAAAAVLALFGFGMWALPYVDGGADQAATDSGGSEMQAADGDRARGPAREESAALADPSAQRLIATGTDYRRDDLRSALSRYGDDLGALGYPVAPSARTFAGGSDQSISGEVPPGLRRLATPPALSACLAEIGKEHTSQAVTTQLVDYAAFEGSAALLVVFTDAGGARWAWAAGPDCGLPGAGADTLYQAQVG